MEIFYILRVASETIALVLFAATLSSAQMDRQLAQRQEQTAALRQYEWKSRTEIQKGGETKKVQVAIARYDSNGNVQKTVVSSTPEPDLPKFGLRKVVAEKKVREFKDTLESLARLAQSYSEIRPEKMQQFMASASFTPPSARENLVRIEGRNVLQPGDSMTVFLDPASRKQRRVEIQTSLEEKAVRIVSEFQDLPQGGPTYMARSQVSYDGASMVIITENFDYTRLH